MLRRPKLSLPAAISIFALRDKFNSILEERLHDGKCENHYIMSIEVNPNDFDLTGNLTSAEKATLWTEVNKGIERFDKNEISLQPRKPQNLLPVAANSGKMLIRSIVHSSSSADDNQRSYLLHHQDAITEAAARGALVGTVI